MNKHRVVSMAIVFAMIAMMLAPGAALASASMSVSAPASAAPGDTVTVTASISLSGDTFKGVSTNSVSLGGLEFVSASVSGFGGQVDARASGFMVYGGEFTSGGTYSCTVRIPMSAQPGSSYTFSVGGFDVQSATTGAESSYGGGSATITVSGGGSGDPNPTDPVSPTDPVNPTDPIVPTDPNPTPGAPTPTPDASGYSYSVSASASKTNVKAGDTVNIQVAISIAQGAYRGFSMNFSGSEGLSVGTPSASGLSPLGLNVSSSGFIATSLSGSTTSSGTVTIPVTIPSDAENGDSFTFTVSGIEGVTENGAAQRKDSVSVKLTVGRSSSSDGTARPEASATPAATPIPVQAPSVRTTLTGAMSGTQAGDTVAFQLRYSLISGEATGFSGSLSYDYNLMEVSRISFVIPSDWTYSADQSSFTITKTGIAPAMNSASEEIVVNILMTLKTAASSAPLLTINNMRATDTQWGQHPLNDASAIASTGTPSFTAAMSAIGDAEPGAYVDIALDFTPMGGAFQGFMGVLEYDETKLSYVSAQAPEGWTVLAQGSQIGVASQENMAFMNETIRMTLRFFVSSSEVARGDTIPITLSGITGQGITGSQELSAYQFSAQDVTLSLAISAATPSFTAAASADTRRTLPGSSVICSLEFTSTAGHLAGFSMDYSLSEGLTLVNVVNDRGWNMTYEGNKLRVYTDAMNAINRDESLRVDFYCNVSAAAPYGSTLQVETGTITGVSHLGETMTSEAVNAGVLVQAAFVNQKTSDYDFTSEISASVSNMNELMVAGKNYSTALKDKLGAAVGYNVCIADMGNGVNVLALDALANATVFEYRQLSLTMEQINQLSEDGIGFLALAVDGGILMVNLDTILSRSTREALEAAEYDLDKASLVLSVEPVTEANMTISESQLLAAQQTVSEPYRFNAYITDGAMQYSANQIGGAAFVLFSLEDVYLTRSLEGVSSLCIVSIDSTTQMVEENEARRLSDLVRNDHVRLSAVGQFQADAIYAAAIG